ncbi:MAG: Flp pilus assembly complex ATPase component TadA [Lachnospiraceae bacterium]|nr:Flp pilus assembly complex ATPase component TadA [Lachnospiraceae bacterium]
MEIGVRKKKRLGDILLEQKLITSDQLAEALVEGKAKKTRIGETLVNMGVIKEIDIARALQKQLGIGYISLQGYHIDDDVLKLVSDQIMKKYCLIPYEFDPINPNVLRVAMSDPMDIMAMDDLAIVTNLQIEPVAATPTDIKSTIDRYFGTSEAQSMAEQYTKEKLEQANKKAEETAAANEEIDNSPIVVLVKTIIDQAARQRCSDIHIEALESKVRIRYRIDGCLKEAMSYDTSLLSGIVARIKIIGGMDISEKRKPQDGRITQVVDGVEYDIRVSILPTVYGEKVVMRMTSKQGLTKPKSALGFSQEEMEKFDRILANPHGIILVTGPTGSGKSTTLYTALSELNTEDVNIITVEDPVEANINGINQVQVNVKAEMTFAAALRSILRQDPDIIMIGEIRDGETASIAVKASITGHLVVSTLHTNSAAATITRLADMGIEPYLIADSTVGVIAQRLVRRLCPKCKKAKIATDMEKELLGVDTNQELTIYEPAGCMDCNETGYKGRIGVYEIMSISPKIKAVISRGGDSEEIKKVALEEGMSTLRMSASRYVVQGITSMPEMKKISFEE